MAISLPTTAAQPLPQTPAQVEALGLRAGQVVEARVVANNANGTTQLAVGTQLVDAALSVRLQPDALIQLLVQGSGAGTRLTVLSHSTPAQGQTPAQSPAQEGVRPQLQPQIQPQAVRGGTPAPVSATGTPATAPQNQAGDTRQAVPQPGAASARPTLVPVTATSQFPQVSAAASPTGAAAPQLVTGSTQTGLPAQLEPGTVLRFQIPGAGAATRPVLVPVTNQPSAILSARETGQIASPATNPLQQAVTQTMQQAVARQDSIAMLLSSLAGLGSKLAEFPNSVARAGAELLASRLNPGAGNFDGAGFKQALARSGVFFESALHKNGGLPLPKGDLKSALLALRNELRLWLGSESTIKSQAQQPPPPPTPGAHPRAGKPVGLPLPANLSGAEAGGRLLAQSDAALARLQLTQLSSLAEGAMRTGPGAAGAASELNIELPMLFGNELSVGQFQIFKDGRNGANGKRDGECKIRFSIHFSQTGEVGATVTLRGGKTSVMLWAEREDIAQALQQSQGELEDALSARGLEPGAIRCRHGIPPQAQKPVGAFMDNCS